MNLRIKIKTLTPIWTGDIDGKCSRVKETGIIGSLRWWYEALVRGCGRYACDPTSDERCPNKDGNKCDVCELFGCTDWGRKFKLEIDGGSEIYSGRLIIKINRNKGWFLSGGIFGDIQSRLEIMRVNTKIKEDEEKTKNTILLLLSLMSKWGGIGAKIQHGYGVFELLDDKGSKVIPLFDFDGCIKKINKEESDKGVRDEKNSEKHRLPNLRKFFFSKIKIDESKVNDDLIKKMAENVEYDEEFPNNVYNKKELLNFLKKKYGFLPTAPYVRYSLRKLIREKYKNNDKIRYEIMGCIKSKADTSDKKASKINISHAYKTDEGFEFRIWGAIPELTENGVEREDILKFLFENISNSKLWEECFGMEIVKTKNDKVVLNWREFNSSRDDKKNEKDITKFIKENLLEM